jgi:hypothetical protein
MRIAIGLLSAAGLGSSAGEAVEEYQSKAAFLFNFAKFVEWPAGAFKNPDEPIQICLLGQNPFGSLLQDTVRDKVVANRTFVVREIPNSSQAGQCHILFVASSEQRRMRAQLEELKDRSILTVGESDGFLSSGGMINLKLEGGRLRLEINVAAADRAKLQVSSKLLHLATIYKK